MEKWVFNRIKIPCIYCGEYIGRYRIHEHIHDIHKDNKCANPMFNKLHGKPVNSIIEYIDDNGRLLDRYKDKARNSDKRDIKFELSFEEYSQLIYCSGLKASDIGYSTGNYILVKIDPDGSFTKENSRFITRDSYHYRGRQEKSSIHENKTGRIPWNKGLTVKTSPSVKAYVDKLKANVPYRNEIDDDGKIYMRYSNKRYNAKAEGIGFELTFAQYCKLVHDAGLKSSDLGYKGNKYVLARYRDIGPYSETNCRFITQKENMDECASHTLYNGKFRKTARSKYDKYLASLNNNTAKDYIIIDLNKYPTEEELHRAKEIGECAKCGKPLSNRKTGSLGLCQNCYKIYVMRNKNMPSRNKLKELIRSYSFTDIGSMYKTSATAIVKWCKHYHLPYQKKVIKKFTDSQWKLI